MRLLSILLVGLALLTTSRLFAESLVSPEEKKLQLDFDKAYRNPDKEARNMALPMMEKTKHSSSWQILYRIASTDPDAAVQLNAFTVLAKVPARDASVAHMLAQLFGAVKFSEKLNYAKAMSTSEFKYELTGVLSDHLSKLRYPDVPNFISGGNTSAGSATSAGNGNQKQIDNIKKQRAEFEGYLEAFNAVAHSEVTSATKESPVLIKKWWEVNQSKVAATEKELLEKYKKEDAEAAKAAKDAAKEAKNNTK